MTWWQVILIGWGAVALVRLLYFCGRALYLMAVKRALLDYHAAVGERRQSPREAWLRKQRLTVQHLLFASGQYDDAPSPTEGGRATKLNLYALESLEHWLSEHPLGMARAREALDKAIGIYLRRGARSLNPFFWISWLLFFPQKVADRIGVAGDPEWTTSLRLLYWTLLGSALVLFVIFFTRL